jgi:zinc transporter ZupT
MEEIRSHDRSHQHRALCRSGPAFVREIHGDENFHHHRSELVDVPVISQANTVIPSAHSGQVTLSQGEKGPKAALSSQQMLGFDKALADARSSVDSMTHRKQDMEEKAALLRVVLLALGILFHSVFIGMLLDLSYLPYSLL